MNRLFAFLLSLSLVLPLAAAAQSPQPPEIAARSWLLVDLSSGQVLAERDADAPADPASLTKLMTAYVVFAALREGRLRLEQTLPVSLRAWNERKGEPSLMFLDPKMTPSVDELLQGMIVQSGNDASVALAEGVAGSVEAFVERMNRQAQAFGLKTTAFRNVTGMTEPGHRSTARDIATIAARLIADFPEYYRYYAVKSYTYHGIRQDNRNLLLHRDPSVDGLKTGYTDAAGYCLVTSAQRDYPNGKRRLLSVVLGAASKLARADESRKLLNWGWTAWEPVRLYEAGQVVATPEVWKGTTRLVRLGTARAVVLSVPKGQGPQLRALVERADPLVAPLARGERVGTIKLTTAAGTAVADVPLVALDGAERAGWFGRAWDAMRLWIR